MLVGFRCRVCGTIILFDNIANPTDAWGKRALIEMGWEPGRLIRCKGCVDEDRRLEPEI